LAKSADAQIPHAGLARLWYSPLMKKYYTRRMPFDPVREMTKVTAERMKMNLELLQNLVFAYAANEKAQQRFMHAVVSRLARIEATVSSIHGIQFIHMQKHGDLIYMEKAREDAQMQEEFIAKKDEELGLAMTKYIYGGPDAFKAAAEAPGDQAEPKAKREQRSRTRRPRKG
jgi:hypothetical protein